MAARLPQRRQALRLPPAKIHSAPPPARPPAAADARRTQDVFSTVACLASAPQDDDNTKEALRYSAALLGELRTTLLRCERCEGGAVVEASGGGQRLQWRWQCCKCSGSGVKPVQPTLWRRLAHVPHAHTHTPALIATAHYCNAHPAPPRAPLCTLPPGCSPQKYYELYLQACDELRNLEVRAVCVPVVCVSVVCVRWAVGEHRTLCVRWGRGQECAC